MEVARVRAALAVNDVLRWLVSEQPPLIGVKWRRTIFFWKNVWRYAEYCISLQFAINTNTNILMSIKFRATRLGMPLSHNYGKWYAKMVPIGNITSEQLAEEVSHLSTVTRSDMLAVLWSLAAVIRRHLLNSEIVHVDGLGSFRIGFRSRAKDRAEDVTADDIYGLRVVMTPDRKFQQTGVTERNGRTGYFTGELIRGAELSSVNAPTIKQTYR